MLSEMSVHSQGGRQEEADDNPPGGNPLEGDPHSGGRRPGRTWNQTGSDIMHLPQKDHGTRQEVTSYTLVLPTSSGGHCSSWFTSYWNPFFLPTVREGNVFCSQSASLILDHCLSLLATRRGRYASCWNAFFLTIYLHPFDICRFRFHLVSMYTIFSGTLAQILYARQRCYVCLPCSEALHLFTQTTEITTCCGAQICSDVVT